jgi:hypothetical protein
MGKLTPQILASISFRRKGTWLVWLSSARLEEVHNCWPQYMHANSRSLKEDEASDGRTKQKNESLESRKLVLRHVSHLTTKSHIQLR